MGARDDHVGHDGGGRGLRYLVWSWDPDPSDNTVVSEYAYLVRDEDGSVRSLHESHTEGLFPRATWTELLEDVGFLVERLPFEHSEEDHEFDVFVCRRPV